MIGRAFSGARTAFFMFLIGAGVFFLMKTTAFARDSGLTLPSTEGNILLESLEDSAFPPPPEPQENQVVEIDTTGAESGIEIEEEMFFNPQEGGGEEASDLMQKISDSEVPPGGPSQNIPPRGNQGADLLPKPAVPVQVGGAPVLAAPEKPGKMDFKKEDFYDTETLVSKDSEAENTDSLKMGQGISPASKVLIVKRGQPAGSRQAKFVAAGRAMDLGRYDSAIEIYEALRKKNKRDPQLLMDYAVALQKAGRTEEALGAYEDLLVLRPDNVEAEVNMLGLIAQKYPAVALRRLASIAEKEKNNIAVVAQLAVTHAYLENYDDALRYYGMAASMEPEKADHVFNMAVIADHKGDKDQAVRYYEQALELDTLGNGKQIPRERVFERLARLR